MDKREILQRIIDSGGDCEWVHKDPKGENEPCRTCPMSKLKPREGGGYYSCWDSLCYGYPEKYLPPEVENELYLKKAIELLQDIVVEDMISDQRRDSNTREDS